MKKVLLFIAMLALVAFSAINKITLPYTFSGQTSPKMAYLDADFVSIKNALNQSIDSINRVRDTTAKYLYARNYSGSGSFALVNGPTIATPTIGSITGVNDAVAIASGDTLKADFAKLSNIDVATITDGSGLDLIFDTKAPNSHASSATTYGVGSSTNYGHVKLYTETGTNLDGSMDQNSINTALAGKQDLIYTVTGSYSATGSWLRLINATLPASSSANADWTISVFNSGNAIARAQQNGQLKLSYRNGTLSAEYIQFSGKGESYLSFGYKGSISLGGNLQVYAITGNATPTISMRVEKSYGGFEGNTNSWTTVNPTIATNISTNNMSVVSESAQLSGATFTGDVSTITEVKNIRSITSTGTTALDKTYSYIYHTGSGGTVTLPDATGSGFQFTISTSAILTIGLFSGDAWAYPAPCSPSATISLGSTCGASKQTGMSATVTDCASNKWCISGWDTW